MNDLIHPQMNDDLIRVGHVLSPFSMNGAVKLYVIGDPTQLLELSRLYVQDTGWLRLRGIERGGPGVTALFVGIEGRDAAERLRGRAVYAHKAELPPLPEDEFYYHELRGLPVLSPSGDRIGEVEDVQDAGAQDLLLVRHGGGTSLVPLQAPYVTVRRGEAIELDAPPGLLEDET